ncbi:AbrB/MazE/SpoVT family DNA-binding domain-containing protein [Bacillus sp. NPDC077411]|uniref:AbrB/MazE/SpoVT family DNA-binding domain-containing protein n=1 Tax=Bacillus sp. NPDC077411 TaxID=3363947 RepID=UPI0037C986F8
MPEQIGSQYLGSLSEVQDSGKGDGSVIITIPKQYVEAIGVQVGRRVEILANNECMFISSIDRPCNFCGTKTELQLVKLPNGVAKELCPNCASLFQPK